MTSASIPVEIAFAEWRKDPVYVKEYDALADEFALADAFIRTRAYLTQKEGGRTHGHDAGGHRLPGERAGDAHEPHT